MCVCVECFLSMQRATTNMECFPLCGGVEKKGGMEDFLKERENSSVMNSRRDCLFHLPPFFFFLLCIFLFFLFLIVYGVLLLLLSGDSLWCYSNLWPILFSPSLFSFEFPAAKGPVLKQRVPFFFVFPYPPESHAYYYFLKQKIPKWKWTIEYNQFFCCFCLILGSIEFNRWYIIVNGIKYLKYHSKYVRLLINFLSLSLTLKFPFFFICRVTTRRGSVGVGEWNQSSFSYPPLVWLVRL